MRIDKTIFQICIGCVFLFAALLHAKPRVYVTGASGFIGGAIVRSLAERDFSVRGLVRDRSITKLFGNAEIAYGDILWQEALVGTLANVDVVVHAAAYVKPMGSYQEYYAVNVEGTENLIRIAHSHGIKRFIYISSRSAFGFEQGRSDISEDDPEILSHLPYARTKLLAEKRVREACTALGMEYVIIRPTIVYGPGDKTFIPGLLKRLDSRVFRYLRFKQARLSLNFIDNLTELVQLAILDKRLNSKLVYSHDKQTTTWEELIRTLQNKVTDLEPYEPRVIPGFMLPSLAKGMECAYRLGGLFFTLPPPPLNQTISTLYASDMTFRSRVLEEIEFSPPTSLPQGLNRTIEWLNSVNWRAFNSK